jgi:hypothetical protein
MSTPAVTALYRSAGPSAGEPDHEAFRPLAADTAIETDPADARRTAAQAVGQHIAEQLRAGRSLFNVVHDAVVRDRIGADGRAAAVRMQPVEAGS